MTIKTYETGTFHNGDCLDVMRSIPDGTVDMILCDLPYGTTQNKWDAVIPFEPLWEQYWRVAKPNAAIVLTASQPFTTNLIASQIGHFKYSYVWLKTRYTGNLNAKIQPLRAHEDVLVFYRKQPTYQAYTEEQNSLAGTTASRSRTKNYGEVKGFGEYVRPDKVTRNSVLRDFNIGKERGLHPTQNPVSLFEHLIKTYTNEDETVLDNTAGSGTTAIAAINTGRKWIGIERDPAYFEIANTRIANHIEAMNEGLDRFLA